MQLKPGFVSPSAPTVGIYFDTRRPTIEKKYPVKIRVIFKTSTGFVQRYYPTGVYLTQNEYTKIREGRLARRSKAAHTNHCRPGRYYR